VEGSGVRAQNNRKGLYAFWSRGKKKGDRGGLTSKRGSASPWQGLQGKKETLLEICTTATRKRELKAEGGPREEKNWAKKNFQA